MAEPAGPHLSQDATQASVGSLVSLAIKDVTTLLRSELALAKLELKADARRVAVGGVLFGAAAFVVCLLVVLLCFALAYGLMALGIWGWAAFLITAGACLVVAGLAALIGLVMFKRLEGLRRTRATVHDDLALLHRDGAAGPPAPVR